MFVLRPLDIPLNVYQISINSVQIRKSKISTSKFSGIQGIFTRINTSVDILSELYDSDWYKPIWNEIKKDKTQYN